MDAVDSQPRHVQGPVSVPLIHILLEPLFKIFAATVL